MLSFTQPVMCEVHAPDPGLGLDMLNGHEPSPLRLLPCPDRIGVRALRPQRGRAGIKGGARRLMHCLRLPLLTAQSPAAVEEILDRENKRMADSLASKVTRLKSVSGGPPSSPPGTLEWGPEGG